MKKASPRAGGLLAEVILDRLAPRYGYKDLAGEYVGRGTTAENLVRHAAFRVLVNEVQEWSAPRDFPKRARRSGST